MQWLRLYHEARNDAKLEALPDDMFRVWFRLLCFAGEQPERGAVIGFDMELLAVEVARGDVDLLARTLDRLRVLRIVSVESDEITFVQWDKRQMKSDDATGRWQEWKTRQGALTPELPSPTDSQRLPNVGPTPPEADAEADVDPETDTEGRRVQQQPPRARTGLSLVPPVLPPIPEVAVTAVEREVIQRVKAVPGMEHVGDEDVLLHLRSLSQVKQLTDDDVRFEAMKFRDYWTDRRTSTKSGRVGPWRNWKNGLTTWFQNARCSSTSQGRPTAHRKHEPDFSGIRGFGDDMRAAAEQNGRIPRGSVSL